VGLLGTIIAWADYLSGLINKYPEKFALGLVPPPAVGFFPPSCHYFYSIIAVNIDQLFLPD
jgi:hypothetical protein